MHVDYEKRLIKRIDAQRMRDVESLHKSFGKSTRGFSDTISHAKPRGGPPEVGRVETPVVIRATVYEPGVSAPLGIDAIDPQIRQFFCIHGVPYLFKDSRNKCRRCIK